MKPLVCVTTTLDFANSLMPAGGSCCGMQEGSYSNTFIWLVFGFLEHLQGMKPTLKEIPKTVTILEASLTFIIE